MLSLLPLLGSPAYSPVQSPEYDAARCYRNWPTKNRRALPHPPRMPTAATVTRSSRGHSHCQIAVAICVAESGGHCDATNTAGNTPPSTDRGLWQINDYWHKEVSNTCAFDCECNGKQAHKISNGGADWSQWATYTGGAYKQYMAIAKEKCDGDVIEAPIEPFAPVAFDDIHTFLRDELNTTYDKMFAEPNEWKYWYDQASGHFHGETDLDPSGHISTSGCSGAVGHCRNNPDAQCESQCGPLPRGDYRLSADTVYHNMEHCYVLSTIDGDMCGRGGFLIHGGSCSSGNPSIGCIVIEDVNVRYKIRGGGHLQVKK